MLILVSDGGVHICLSQCMCVFGFPVRVPCFHPLMVANARCFFPYFIIFILTIVAFTFPVMSSPPGFRFPHSFPFATFAWRTASLSRRLPLRHRRHSRTHSCSSRRSMRPSARRQLADEGGTFDGIPLRRAVFSCFEGAHGVHSQPSLPPPFPSFPREAGRVQNVVRFTGPEKQVQLVRIRSRVCCLIPDERDFNVG